MALSCIHPAAGTPPRPTPHTSNRCLNPSTATITIRGQALRDSSKTVSLLGEGDSRLACLAGNVLMAVQDHLGRKGGMTADLDGEMAPLWIEDMKRVVVDVVPAPAKAGGIGFLRSMWCLALISHTGACARPTRTRNKPWVTVVLARYSSARSCLRCPAEQSITGMSCALA